MLRRPITKPFITLTMIPMNKILFSAAVVAVLSGVTSGFHLIADWSCSASAQATQEISEVEPGTTRDDPEGSKLAHQLSVDWHKLGANPDSWIGKRIDLEGWLYVTTDSSGEVVRVALYDDPDSRKMRLHRRGVEIPADQLLKVFPEQRMKPTAACMRLNGACVEITGTFRQTFNIDVIGILDGPILLKILPDQEVAGVPWLNEFAR
jgi:hypothetical protein